MDNLTETIYIVERIEISPHNADKLYAMDYFKILTILNNNKNHKNLEDILKLKNVTTKNFKFNNEIFVLKNRDVYDYLKRNNYRSDYEIILKQTLIDISNINYYLISYYEDSFNYFMIVITIDTNKLDKNFYDNFTLSNPNKENKLFVSYLLTLMKYHFEEINNIRNESCENSLISKLISENTTNYMYNKMIEQPNFLNTKLFMYQKANIYWMLERENNEKDIILDDTMIVNFGPQLEFNFSNLKFGPKRTVETMQSDKLNKFLGGCLCDDVGLGKTVQILTLCFMNNTDNLIIVPKHLLKHWINEFNKHIKLPDNSTFQINNLEPSDKKITLLISFDNLNSDITNKEWDRLIVDEYHETVNSVQNSSITKIKSKFKWAVTATPFVNKEMIHNIMNFIAKNKIQSKNIGKYKMYINLFADMFRKNTKRTIEKEIKLPKIKESSYYLNFSDKEKLFYDTLMNTNGDKLEQMRRFFCINPSLYFTENHMESNFVEINLMDDKIKNIHKETFEMEFTKLLKLKFEMVKGIVYNIDNYRFEKKLNDYLEEFIETLVKTNKMKDDEIKTILKSKYEDYFYGENHEERINVVNMLFDLTIKEELGAKNKINEIIAQQKVVDSIKSTMNYFEEQIKEINESKEIVKDTTKNIEYVKVELEKDCGICLGEIEDKFTILQCGHMYCTECISAIMQTNLNKCPTCKLNLKNTIIYTINNDNKEKLSNDLVNLYGTKIANLINISKTLEGKIVLFSYSASLLSNIKSILNTNNIKSLLITDDNIHKVNDFYEDDNKVLILSSDYNASGLNITCAKNIIVLEPLKRDYMYRKQIENQIIGRLHRIGQDKEINFIRLIMMNSIEHDIDKENKINDAIYSNKEFDLDMEKVKFVF